MPEVRSHVLLIGGRSGAGKSTAAIALHELLSAAAVQHAVVEGDYLDLAYPAPHEEGHDLAGRNLTAVWGNYRELGYRRLVFTNTASVVVAARLSAAMGDDPLVTSVLLRASDDTAARRLRGRALGPPAGEELVRSARTAVWLDEACGSDVVRLDTEGLGPQQIAVQLATLTGWT